MGIKNTSGFTIIEVMLFLGVSGVLTAALLVGSGISIGQQRYRDSVNSLKSLVQEQYGDVTSVANDRGDDASCANAGTSAVIKTPPQAVQNPQPRGTSECMLIGRMLTIGTNGTTVTTQDVVAVQKSTTKVDNDLADMHTNYNYGLSSINQATTEVAWGAQVVNPAAARGAFKGLSLLIVRSPMSGIIMTFADTKVVTNPATLIAGSPVARNTDVCVNADRTSFVGQPLAIRIDAYAASESAVEIPTESEGVCG